VQKSSIVEEEHLYGCFSPHGSPPKPHVLADFEGEGIDGIMAPVIQIMRNLHDLSGESSMVLPLVLGSFQALAVATTLSTP
jgi:hypothetical protein